MEFQFLQPRGCLTNLLRTLSLCFGVIDKTPGLTSHNNFVKKISVCIGYCNNVLARCDSIFPLLRFQECGRKCAHNFLFSKLSFRIQRTSLRDVQRFCYHSWCDSMVIFDQISNSTSVYLSLSWFWMATSLIIFYQLPSVSKSRITSKNFWLVHIRIPVSLLHQY